MARSRHRRKGQRGFALLLIFLMASVVAITLYMELPRVAMQAQRDKEEMLIDRGEQYKRAIQLFVKKTQRYPSDIKELENFQNQRFLRHRYEDPMTGKDEWRLVHIQNGVLTDSKLTKPNGPGKDDPKNPNTFITEMAAVGSGPSGPAGGGAASVRDRRRPSEGANATMPGDLNSGPGANTGAPPSPNPGDPTLTELPGTNPTTQQPGQPTYPGQPGMPGLPGGMPGQNGIPGVPGMPGMPGRLNPATGNSATTTGGTSFVSSGGPFIGGSVSSPGSQPGTTGYPGLPGSPVNSQTGGVSPYSTVPGANGTSPTGFNQPGTTTGGAAADMIRNILTTPRAGGAPMANMGGQTIGGGIAGIASTAEGEGVKVYNDRTLYQEWEFIFDPAKQKQIPNPNATGAGGTPVDRMNNPNGTGTGTNPINPRSSGGLGR